ncbi:MAG: response regulator transcription factor [Bdellovibrionaceae bacterium]|nr:response regulator transcription factor [Pseudobdellovibrionaceae bacterium]MBX3034122.1 response regulator transcription factor [Pseudobdellovibrionaceae bacterium]
MRRVLLVEDDLTLGENLRDRLAQDYDVSWARSVRESEELLGKHHWDLAILDIGLPDGNGFDIAEKIARKDGCHFVFLTAQSDAESRLKGFELGAQEFIPKPFYLKELLLRVKHVLDSHPAVAREIKLRDVVVNLQDFFLRRADGAIEYPPVTDMKILKLLVEKSPQVVSRDEILDHVWGIDKTPNHRTVDNAVVRLRQLLGADGERIHSVRGIGYQWMNEEPA